MSRFVCAQRLHFIGIGGAGMAPIAEACLRRGFEVSGSDARRADTTDYLGSLGCKVLIGHDEGNLQDADLVVCSSAISKDNPELLKALEMGRLIISRAELLACLMKGSHSIACAGTHGKTTTTAILGGILTSAARDPSVVLGGRSCGSTSNLRWGDGEDMVVEADESDGSFLCLPCKSIIVTSIDDDHLEYYGSMDRLIRSFLAFINSLGADGLAVLCIDDARIRDLLDFVEPPFVTYGRSRDADYRVEAVEFRDLATTFSLVLPDGRSVEELSIAAPGVHYALNSAACCALAREIGCDPTCFLPGLASYKGVERRFELLGSTGDILVVDDYAHHPTEISAVIASAREAMPERRIVVAFQPHRESRTELLARSLARELLAADRVYLLTIYKPICECDGAGNGAGGLEKMYCFLLDHGDLEVNLIQGEFSSHVPLIAESLKEGDCLLTLGAGSVTELGPMLLDFMKSENG